MSLSSLQRELGVTYFHAARIFEHLEHAGLISRYDGSLSREILLDSALWQLWDQRNPRS